jgi:quercetin dioxygenase-like cupin family protein
MLDIENGEEIQMREILFAPGWKAPRHYHNSDLFIYVIAGEFEVDMEGSGLKTYTDGQALRMMPNTPMDARNSSAEKPLKLAVFQVGNPDSPFVVPVDGQVE